MERTALGNTRGRSRSFFFLFQLQGVQKMRTYTKVTKRDITKRNKNPRARIMRLERSVRD